MPFEKVCSKITICEALKGIDNPEHSIKTNSEYASLKNIGFEGVQNILELPVE